MKTILSRSLLAAVLACLSVYGSSEKLELLGRDAHYPVRVHGLSQGRCSLSEHPLPTGEMAQSLSFVKERRERGMMCFSLSGVSIREAFRSIEMSVFMKSNGGLSCRPFVMFEEKDGGSWLRYGDPLRPGDNDRIQLSLAPQALYRLSFTSDGDGVLTWPQVARVSLGVLADGEGKGEVRFSGVRLKTAAYRPSKPYVLTLPKTMHWHKSQDRAVRDVSLSDVVVDGVPCIRLRFRFPTGRHMFFTPRFPLPQADYASYSGLRLTYKSRTPKPLNSLLVMLMGHRGSYSYQGRTQPVSTGEWRTCTMMFRDFKGVGWEKVKGESLPVSAVLDMVIGCHGTCREDCLGEILVKKLELIP